MFKKSTFFQNPSRFLWLIITCLTLLGLSQVFWLKRVWGEQRRNFQQETNYIFQGTVRGLQDSLMNRSVTRSDDPLHRQMPLPKAFLGSPFLPGLAPELRTKGKIHIRRNIDENSFGSEYVEETKKTLAFIAAADSAPMAVKHGQGRFVISVLTDSLAGNQQDLVFQIQTDSISPEEVQNALTAALDTAGFPTTFHLLTTRSAETLMPKSRTALRTLPAVSGLLHHQFFMAEFYDYQSYLLRKTLPYILFSFFLFSLTSLSFWLIFTNLKQQRKLSQQKNEFISNISHELKTPLTTVGVALEALDDFEVLRNPEKAKEYLKISKLELERLKLLVDKVLQLSMFQQQALLLQPELLNFTAITRQVIQAMTLQAEGVRASIQLHVDKAPCMVYFDRLLVSGVVYNLLDNALKYRRGTPEIDVFVEKKMHSGQEFVTLKVMDNGQGIAPEYQSHIFEKFFRVPTGNTHNVKGHGLGLSYVAQIAREHGGNIWVESVLGQGSTFTVEIPAATPPPTA